ncbi:MAG: DNA-directed RNA polymerase subunit beta [Selenomonadaceae bacterium]|nr:DNA-directed RNA polymerase subunit beta [Selenomonadaceae bacterium]
MLNPVKVGKRLRYSYARIKEVMQMPHLLDIQRNSYNWFKREGLQEIFKDISPIADFSGNLELFFGEPTFGESKYTLAECKRRDGTYAAPVRVKVTLRNKIKGDVKQQEVFMGDFPIMTETGTFIINGAERVIVSQLVRSPGAYYDKTIDLAGKNIYNATVIPNRGAWIELETDSSSTISVRIDRTRKMPVTYFLRALDFETNEQILDLFDVKFFIVSKLYDQKTSAQLIDFLAAESENGTDRRNPITIDYLRRQPTQDTFDQLLAAYAELDEKNDLLSNYKYLLDTFAALEDKNTLTAGYKALVDMLDQDRRNGEDNKEKALIGIYNRLRPGEPPSADNAASLLQSQFFDPRRYDLAAVGRYKITKKLGWKRRVLGKTLAEDLFDQETGELLIPADTLVTQDILDAIPDEREIPIFIGWERLLLGEVLTEDIRDSATGKLVFPVGEVITQDMLDNIPEDRKDDIFKLAVKKLRRGYRWPIPIKIKTENGAFTMLCAPTLSIKENRTICVADIISSINYIFNLMSDTGFADDIDHLGNRRVRSVGELLQNQFRIGMARMERVVRERMTTQDAEIVTPQNLINIRPVVAAIKEFFGSSQLSQFMDQHNPLSELTHKRRLSALGPGGLSRERAGFEVRDVHNSHYGRMCPIETPEGPNIGLIGSLSNYARVNQFGFMETPYRRVDKENHRVTNDVRYMTADEEESLIIAQANEPLDDNDWFINERVTARRAEETTKVRRDSVDYMDVSPKQVVSIATAMIPFLENDDANRALMGANMQRQAVPLLKTQAPLVGTGMEFKAACDSGVMILARRSGTVVQCDAQTIRIKVDPDFVTFAKDTFDTYHLQKFVRSNQGTCINQIPIVEKGEHVQARQPIADGPATSNGELALGYNIIVAYMPWEGYNYEDAILLSENLIKRDIYTSIHIKEYQCDARDTKLGPEEVTRDIPNVSEDALTHLDSEGIIAIGADVRTGDILVGKVTPKGETELTAEERLLRAIFGEKAREVRDTSLKVPHGESGKIVAVNVFTRENNDEMAPGVNKQVRVYIAQKRKISVGDKMSGRHGNKGVVSEIRRQEDMPFLPDGTPVDIVLNPLGVPSRMNIGQVLETHLGMAVRKIGLGINSLEVRIDDLRKYLKVPKPIPNDDKPYLNLAEREQELCKLYSCLMEKISECLNQFSKLGIVKISEELKDIAEYFNIQDADFAKKLSDLSDRTCVISDIPARINRAKDIGGDLDNIIKRVNELHIVDLFKKFKERNKELNHLSVDEDEIHVQKFLSIFLFFKLNNMLLELVAIVKTFCALVFDLRTFGFDVDKYGLPNPSEAGLNISTPVFDGARDEDIMSTIELAGLDEDGKTILYDGRTGEPFENRVTVGCVYMLKLHHLVDDKIHARSTGPYSLVTQQPLGGKAQFGGQRFGEMEVWALEAYGASYTLQEILTVKSDDVLGRVKAYEAIVKGLNIPEPGVPESFKVIIKELQSIALDIAVLSKDNSEVLISDDDDDDFPLNKKAKEFDLDVSTDSTIISDEEA